MKTIHALAIILALNAPFTPLFESKLHAESALSAAHECDCPPECECHDEGGTCPAECTDACECHKKKTAGGLTFEQFRIKQELDAAAKAQGWTFKYNPAFIGKHGLGYKPEERLRTGTERVYRAPADAKLKSFKLADFGIKMAPTRNQGSCGSCVYFSITLNFMNSLLLRGFDIPQLSEQHLMNCGGSGSQCGGAFGSGVAGALVKMGGLTSLQKYPYTARSSRCQQPKAEKFGQILGYESIDPSPRTILAAIHEGKPVSAGVAVDRAWAAFDGGVYNACGSMSTNHYIDIEGVDCETSVDADKNCVFDEDGNLPNGVGTYLVHNSHSTDWGDDGGLGGEGGYMISKITDRRGRRCNNLAGEGEVLDIGVPMAPKEPVTFVVPSKYMQKGLTVTVQPGYSAEIAKKEIEAALASVEK